MAHLLWQRLFGTGAAVHARRIEAVKSGCVEAAARNVSRARAASASAGILHALVS